MNKKTIIILLSVFILAVVLIFFYDRSKNQSNDENGVVLDNTTQEAINIVIDENGVPIDGSGYTVEIIPSESIPVPDLDRPIVFNDSFPGDAKVIVTENIKKLTENLKNNNDFLQDWLDLGLQRKIIGDYEGAIECWKYASLIRPESYVSFNNMGDVYGFYLGDKKKAEENFLKALEIAPDKIHIYISLNDFYRNIMKDDNKARAILEKGIKLNPNTSSDLQNLLDTL